jgi:hypothetical protein
VEKWCNIIEESAKINTISCSHYFRSAPGTGKTIFLMLLEKELESKNSYDVYYFNHAKCLDKYTERSFIQARAKALKQGKTLVIMVDEVHHNTSSSLWNYLLKSTTDIIVIGIGIPEIEADSPHFMERYSPSEMYFDCNSEDMEELVDLFVELTKGRGISRNEIAAICHYICEYTGGHMFAMVKFCEHILFDQAQSDHLGNYEKYLTSKAFMDHEDYQMVRDRCFSILQDNNTIYGILYGGVYLNDYIDELFRFGYWNNNKKGRILSKCVIDIILNEYRY